MFKILRQTFYLVITKFMSAFPSTMYDNFTFTLKFIGWKASDSK